MTLIQKAALYSRLAYNDNPAAIVGIEVIPYRVRSRRHDVEACAFVDPEADTLTIAVRGTEPTEIRDIWTDLMTYPYWRMLRWGLFHAGAHKSAKALFPWALDLFTSGLKGCCSPPATTRQLTGHSLGGMTAIHLHYMLARARFVPHDTWTFGAAPCVNFWDDTDARALDTHRIHAVENHRDPVPRMNIRDLYERAGYLRYLMPDGSDTTARPAGITDVTSLRQLTAIATSNTGDDDITLDDLKQHSIDEYCRRLGVKDGY